MFSFIHLLESNNSVASLLFCTCEILCICRNWNGIRKSNCDLRTYGSKVVDWCRSAQKLTHIQHEVIKFSDPSLVREFLLNLFESFVQLNSRLWFVWLLATNIFATPVGCLSAFLVSYKANTVLCNAVLRNVLLLDCQIYLDFVFDRKLNHIGHPLVCCLRLCESRADHWTLWRNDHVLFFFRVVDFKFAVWSLPNTIRLWLDDWNLAERLITDRPVHGRLLGVGIGVVGIASVLVADVIHPFRETLKASPHVSQLLLFLF